MEGRVEEPQQPIVTGAQLRSYESAAAKGRQWLLGRIQPDGSFDARSQNLRCYLRSPLALLMTGEPRAAYLLLNTLEKQYLCDDGDFRTSPEAKYGTAPFNMKGEKNFYLYGNGWCTIGAHLNGRFDISCRALAHLLRFQDPWTGGYSKDEIGPTGARE